MVDISCCRQARYLMVDRGDTVRLSELADWVYGGRLVPVVDQTYAISSWEEAVARGHARGRMGRTVLCFGEPDRPNA
jgi:hypothetical protein